MLRILLLVLAASGPLISQIAVTPARIAGLSPANWSIGDGGPAIDALLSPAALAWDRTGNLLIADSRNQRVRQIAPGGVISTRVSQGGVVSMAVDSQNNLYVSVSPPSFNDTAHIYEFPLSGAQIEIPNPGSQNIAPAIAIDAANNLYVTDELAAPGGLVWKRSPSGSVSVIAGQAGPTLYGPHAFAFDSASNLLIADYDGVLRLNPDGSLVRLFEDLGAGLSRIAPAADGSIYFIGDLYGIWRWTSAGGATLFAGTQQPGFSDGCALSGGQRVAKYASMNPSDLIFDSSGDLYIADNFIDSSDPGAYYYSEGRIRRIDPDGSILTVAGTGSLPNESAPGIPALGAIFHNPEALAVDTAGNVFFAESGHVNEITAGGQFLTVAGTDSPPANQDPTCYSPTGSDVLSSPRGIATDAAGNLYISDTGNNRIRRRSVDGTITTIAGTGVAGQSGDGGPAVEAEISGPTAIAAKPDGSVYFVSDGVVRRIGTDGIIDSPQAPQSLGWLAVGFDGRLILSGEQLLYKEDADGSFDALRSGVGEVTTDPMGAIYSPSEPLLRISANCNVAPVTFPLGLIAQVLQGLVGDATGNIYLTADNSIWRIAPITPPAVDSPSLYLNSPGVYNAASNLVVDVTPPTGSCFEFHYSNCYPYAVNDSIAGNEILHITGGCMGPLEPLNASASGGQLPVELQGTQVLFDGEAAPLLSVQATGILAIVPQDVASKTQVTLAVENQGVAASVVLGVVAAAPGIFVSSGTQAAAINEDGTLNGADHPAPVGSIVAIFLTGTGPTQPPIPDGILPSLPLAPLALPVTVQVGGMPANVRYAGSAVGLPGLAQVNIQIPALPPSNAVPLQVAVGGISRNQTVTIAVQ